MKDLQSTKHEMPLWEIFIQKSPGAPHQHMGSVRATDREMALQHARDVYTRRAEGTSIWVVPNDAISSTTEGDKGPFFDPADDKPYRYPHFYKAKDHQE